MLLFHFTKILENTSFSKTSKSFVIVILLKASRDKSKLCINLNSHMSDLISEVLHGIGFMTESPHWCGGLDEMQYTIRVLRLEPSAGYPLGIRHVCTPDPEVKPSKHFHKPK